MANRHGGDDGGVADSDDELFERDRGLEVPLEPVFAGWPGLRSPAVQVDDADFQQFGPEKWGQNLVVMLGHHAGRKTGHFLSRHKLPFQQGLTSGSFL